MRSRSQWAAAGLLGAAWLGPTPAAADNPVNAGVRIDQLQLASPESAFFRPEGPHDPATEGVEFATGLGLEYAKGVLNDNLYSASGAHTTTALVSNVVLARVAGSVTPLRWLSFDLSLPFALYETGNTPATAAERVQKGIQAGKGPGVGDLRIGVHFRPVDTTAFNLNVGGRVWAPFGTQGAYLSDGTVRAEIDLGVAGDGGPVLWGCSFNVGPGYFVQRAGDRLAGSCALYGKLGSVVTLGVEPTFEVATIPRVGLNVPSSNGTSLIFEPLGGLRFRAGDFRFGVAAGPGFGGGVGAADFRTLLSVNHVGLGKAPKAPVTGPADRDLDEIPDNEDACPDEAGPPSKNPNLNGCPAHDRDGDGIPDEQDSCPDRPGIPYPDPKGNGCPDSDNDGLPDPVDPCVGEPGPGASGCPRYARLALGDFKIDPPIELGSGDRLPERARAALEEVAATLRANPKIEHVTLTLGTKGVKSAVSDKRAQEILLVLRAANLDPARYEVLLRDTVRPGLVQVKVGK